MSTVGCSWAKAPTLSQVLGHFGDTGRDRGIKTTEQDSKERSVERKISSGQGLQEWSQNSLQRKRT